MHNNNFQKSSNLTRGYLICISATLLFSGTAIIIRHLTETYHIPALNLAFWRDAFVFITLFLIFIFVKPSLLKLNSHHAVFLISYGFVLSVFNALWTVSVALNGASVATVLAYGSTAFTAVLGWRLFEEQLGIVKIMVVLVCLTGCFLVAGAYDLSEWQVNPLGLISGLLTGLGFAIYSLMGRASSNRKINPWTATLYVFGIASLFLLLFSVFADWLPNGMGTQKVFWLGDKWIGWVLLFILSAGPTAGGFGLYTVSLTYLPASVVNLIATLEPVLTVILAFILLGERLTFVQLIGSALIIIAIVSLRLYEGNSLKKTANAAVI